MNRKWNTQVVKPNLRAHTWLGLFAGGLLYLIAVSGTLSVFFEEFDRWEQPNIPEYGEFSPEYMNKAITEYVARLDRTPESIYIVLPTEGFPRTHITDGIDEWYLDESGAFLDEPNVPWTMLVRELHAHLLLPHLVGSSIIGLMGVMCLALIISGVLAHPSIFKDAFVWRAGKTRRVQEMDFHNRLGVWGLPFHFMIAVTGAFIGLGSLLMGLTSMVLYSGDPDDVVEAIYGSDPVLENQSIDINFNVAFENLKQREPGAKPIYIVVHKYGKDDQLFEIAATLPERLVYSEMYRFNSEGRWLGQQGLASGPAGGQVAYSTYRLHYGHFDSGWVKLLYGLMGVAFTYLIVSGINIWFARRKFQTWVNNLWQGWVWGVLNAFAASCWLRFLNVDPVTSFMTILFMVTVLTPVLGRKIPMAPYLYIGLAFNLLLIPLIYMVVNGGFELKQDFLVILTASLVLALLFIIRAFKRMKIKPS